jgi:hypothetical protein
MGFHGLYLSLSGGWFGQQATFLRAALSQVHATSAALPITTAKKNAVGRTPRKSRLLRAGSSAKNVTVHWEMHGDNRTTNEVVRQR